MDVLDEVIPSEVISFVNKRAPRKEGLTPAPSTAFWPHRAPLGSPTVLQEAVQPTLGSTNLD
jgi:hypothetical protein